MKPAHWKLMVNWAVFEAEKSFITKLKEKIRMTQKIPK